MSVRAFRRKILIDDILKTDVASNASYSVLLGMSFKTTIIEMNLTNALGSNVSMTLYIVKPYEFPVASNASTFPVPKGCSLMPMGTVLEQGYSLHTSAETPDVIRAIISGEEEVCDE